MALIRCKECGHEVSDKASTCPNCGCPIEKGFVCDECGAELSPIDKVCPNCGNPIQTVKKKYGATNIKAVFFVLLAIFVFGGGFFAWNYSTNNTDGGATADSLTLFNEDEEQMREEQEKTERQAERIREEQARQQYMEREQQKSQQRENARASQNNSNDDNSIYSTDEGRQAYLEVLQLQKEARELIDRSAPYRNIMQREVYGSYNYQTAKSQNMNILSAAIRKQERALSIARNKLHDESLIRELEGQLKVLYKGYSFD